ncbi:MAG: hypothetical protein HZC48_10090 [Nitrospirae bacterium]|nr:hypothetical protein [Nitrospirota bacterium]
MFPIFGKEGLGKIFKKKDSEQVGMTAKGNGMKQFISIITLLSFIFVFIVPSVHADTALTYDYDANGNLIRGDGKYYEYNDANKLVKVRHGDQSGPIIAEYFYDYNGQRIKKVENGVATYYIGKHTITEVSGSGTTNTKHYFANNERVAQKDISGNLTFYHSDHLGGTNAITDSGGNLVERTKYYPFGEIRLGGNERFTFTGKEKDQVTDQYYFEARYYNPELKHFTQADNIEPDYYDPQDLNRYAYVSNNPIKLIDPSGHFWLDTVMPSLGNAISRGVDKVINAASNNFIADIGGNAVLRYVGAPKEGGSAEYWSALAGGLDHSYNVSKSAFGKAITDPFSLTTAYDLTVMLAEETGYFTDGYIDNAKKAGAILSLLSLSQDMKSLRGKKDFHFNLKDYKFLVKRLGRENYSKLRHLINDGKLDGAKKIISGIGTMSDASQTVLEKKKK